MRVCLRDERSSSVATYHFCGRLRVLGRHVLLQRHLRVAHPAAVGTREGLRLLHRERLSAIVQVCRVGEAGLAVTRANLWCSLQVGMLEEDVHAKPKKKKSQWRGNVWAGVNTN